MSEVKKADWVTIHVDGKPYEVPSGMNLIDAVWEYAKTEIPHYCYHPKLSVAGNCRMCLVEMGTPMRDRNSGEPIVGEDGSPKIGWMPKPAIACSTRTSEGLHVKTDSPMVQDCRNGVMEFLLLNHPLDCPICDQAGECRLQEFATDYGRGYSRYIEEKNVKPKRSRIGPRITLDDERCILCSRCVRFSQEITKDNVLGFVDRGSYSTLTCYPGRELDNNYSLNVVDICPVGALTDNDFRFKMRVWFLKPTHSICTESSVGVNTTVWSREGKIYRITPRRNDAVNDTWMSDSGRRLYRITESENRLLKSRVGEEAVAFDQAITRAAEYLKKDGVAVVGSGRMSVEEQFSLACLSAELGASTWLVPHLQEGDGFLISNDPTPNVRGTLVTGLAKGLDSKSLDKLSDALAAGKLKTLLVWGEDLLESGLDPAVLKGVDIVYAGTQENRTSQLAKVCIPSRCVFEKQGSFVNQAFRIQRFQKAVPGPGETVNDLDVIAALTRKLGHNGIENGIKGVWEKMAIDIPEFSGMDWASIGDEGKVIDSTRFEGEAFCEAESLHFKGPAVQIMKGKVS